MSETQEGTSVWEPLGEIKKKTCKLIKGSADYELVSLVYAITQHLVELSEKRNEK